MLDVVLRVHALVLPNLGGPEATGNADACKTREAWVREHIDALCQLAEHPARGGPALPRGCGLHQAGPLVPPRISAELSGALLLHLRQALGATITLATTPALTDPELATRLEIAVRHEVLAQPPLNQPTVVSGNFAFAEAAPPGWVEPVRQTTSGDPAQRLAALRARIDYLLAHGPPREHPPDERVNAALAALREGTGTTRDMEVLMRKAVQDARSITGISALGSVDPAFSGACGVGSDVAAVSLASLLAHSGIEATIRRYQAHDLFGARVHAFCTVQFHGNGAPDQLYLMDSTYAQFVAHSERRPECGNVLLGDIEGCAFLQPLLEHGIVALTEHNAGQFGRGIGALPASAHAGSLALMQGEQALTVDSVGGPQALAIGRRLPEHDRDARLVNLDFADDVVNERIGPAIRNHERWGNPYGEAEHLHGLNTRLEAVLRR